MRLNEAGLGRISHPGTAGNDELISEKEAPTSSALTNSETEPRVPTEM